MAPPRHMKPDKYPSVEGKVCYGHVPYEVIEAGVLLADRRTDHLNETKNDLNPEHHEHKPPLLRNVGHVFHLELFLCHRLITAFYHHTIEHASLCSIWSRDVEDKYKEKAQRDDVQDQSAHCVDGGRATDGSGFDFGGLLVDLFKIVPDLGRGSSSVIWFGGRTFGLHR